MSDPRNWKWMVPGIIFSVLMLMTRYLLQSPTDWVRGMGIVPGVAAMICAIAAIGNFIDYRREHEVSVFERRRRAMAFSALANELEGARGVSPESVKVLVNERHRVWMLKSGVKVDGIMPHSVLYGAPDVTDFFLQYFLEGSTEKSVMPKRVLSEGRKNRFDPWGAVDEYTMYDRLIALLERQGKVRRWSEFDSYEWIEPWSPELVAEDFGLEWVSKKDAVSVDEVK